MALYEFNSAQVIEDDFESFLSETDPPYVRKAILAYKLPINSNIPLTSRTAQSRINHDILHFCYYSWNEFTGELVLRTEITPGVNGGNIGNVEILRQNARIATRISSIPQQALGVVPNANRVLQNPGNFKLVYFSREEFKRLYENANSNSSSILNYPSNILYFVDSKVSYLIKKGNTLRNKSFPTLYSANEIPIADDNINAMRVVSIAQGIPCPPKWDEGVNAVFEATSNANSRRIMDMNESKGILYTTIQVNQKKRLKPKVFFKIKK